MYIEAGAKNLPKGAEVECVGILDAPGTVGARFQSGESLSLKEITSNFHFNTECLRRQQP